jgi:hypothetical protein
MTDAKKFKTCYKSNTDYPSTRTLLGTAEDVFHLALDNEQILHTSKGTWHASKETSKNYINAPGAA